MKICGHFWRPVFSILSVLSYHDNQGYVCGPQSFKSFWPISGPPVVEGGTCNIEPTWRVNGQLPIDIVLVPFTLQHWDTEEREKENDNSKVSKVSWEQAYIKPTNAIEVSCFFFPKFDDIIGHFLICCVAESEMRSSRFVSEIVLWSRNTGSRGNSYPVFLVKRNSSNRSKNVLVTCCILSARKLVNNTSKHQLV